MNTQRHFGNIMDEVNEQTPKTHYQEERSLLARFCLQESLKVVLKLRNELTALIVE